MKIYGGESLNTDKSQFYDEMGSTSPSSKQNLTNIEYFCH